MSGRNPRVLNKRTDVIPADAVYVGRPSKWGNPFVMGKDGTLAECVQQYLDMISVMPHFILAIRRELKGKDLVCWCAPQLCHANVLRKIANN